MERLDGFEGSRRWEYESLYIIYCSISGVLISLTALHLLHLKVLSYLVRVEHAEILQSRDWKVIQCFYPLIGFVDVFSNPIQWPGVQTNKTRLFSANQINAQTSTNGSRNTTRSKTLYYLFFLYKCRKWIWFFCIWKEAGIKQFLKSAIMFEHLPDLHNIFCKLSGTCSWKTPCLFGCLIGVSYFTLSLNSLSDFGMEILENY